MGIRINQRKVIRLVQSMKEIVFQEELRKDIHLKGKGDFVTAIDLRISEELKTKLKVMYPHIGFFCEEEEGCLVDPCWILDPIDGTKNLVYGQKQSSVSLGLYADEKIQFGVVYNPYTNECFHAARGKGAYCGKKKIHVSNRGLSQAIVDVGVGATHKELVDQTFAMLKEIFIRCMDIRRINSSALNLCYIADGRIDGMVEPVLKPWDVAAGSLILEEAGGKITNYLGQDLDFKEKTTVLATNSIIHKELKEILKKYN